MAEAAKGINPETAPQEVTEELKEMATEVMKEEIKVATEEIVAEAKEEVKEDPSRIRKNCANWQQYGRVLASGQAPPDRISWAPALPGCTARSGRR